MAIIPYMGEVLALSLALSYHLTDWSVVEIALFASVLAPLGPSVIVVGLLSLVETSKDKTVVKSVEKDNINGVVCSNGSGTSSENDIEEEDAAESVAKDYGFIPKLILMSAPIEAVLSIVLFEILATLLQDSSPLYPWVIHLPLVANCILIPVNIIFSITMGMIVGYCCAQYFLWRRATSQNSSYKYMNKNYQLGKYATIMMILMA